MTEYITGGDRCVCCGAVIPEGGWICLDCLVYVKDDDYCSFGERG